MGMVAALLDLGGIVVAVLWAAFFALSASALLVVIAAVIVGSHYDDAFRRDMDAMKRDERQGL